MLVAPGRQGECEAGRDRGGAANQREGHREPVIIASGTQRVGRLKCSGVASPTPCRPHGWGLFSGRAFCRNSGVRAGYRRYGPPASAPGPSLKKRRECRDARAARSPQGGGDARTAYKFRKQASGAREGAMKALAAAQVGKFAQEAFSRDHLRASRTDRRQFTRDLDIWRIAAQRAACPHPPNVGVSCGASRPKFECMHRRPIWCEKSGDPRLRQPDRTHRHRQSERVQGRPRGDRERRRRHRVRAPS